MTTAQKQLAIETLKELEALAPAVDWSMTWNYYTKLPQFTALKDGGVSFRMDKEERKQKVVQDNGISYIRYTGEKFALLSATVDHTTKRQGAFVVSGAHSWDKLPKNTIEKELPRINFKAYVQFIKDNLGVLERIGG